MSSLDDTRTLKSLYSTETKYKKWLKECRDSKNLAEANIVEAEKSLKNVQKQIADLVAAPRDLIVTEHAILRYLERWQGMDLQPIVDAIRKLPASKAIRKGNSIVTVEKEPQS